MIGLPPATPHRLEKIDATLISKEVEGNIITSSRPIHVEARLEIEDKTGVNSSNAQPKLPPIDPRYVREKKKQSKARYGSVSALDEMGIP